jgi:hypothetical protein
VTSPSLTSPDFQACVRSTSPGSLLSPGGVGSPSCSGSVLGGSGFRRGSLPRGSLPCLAECPAGNFFFAFRLQQRIAYVSAAATRRIITLFSRNFSATVCMSTHGHPHRQLYRQTDIQTDHGIYHTIPRGSWWRICGIPYHTIPRYHSGADL